MAQTLSQITADLKAKHPTLTVVEDGVRRALGGAEYDARIAEMADSVRELQLIDENEVARKSLRAQARDAVGVLDTHITKLSNSPTAADVAAATLFLCRAQKQIIQVLIDRGVVERVITMAIRDAGPDLIQKLHIINSQGVRFDDGIAFGPGVFSTDTALPAATLEHEGLTAVVLGDGTRRSRLLVCRRLDGSTFAWVDVSGEELLRSLPFSAVSSVSFDNCFSASYSNYRIVMSLTAISAMAHINMRLRAGGVDASGTDYFWSLLEISSLGTTVDKTGAEAAQQWNISFEATAAQSSVFGTYEVAGPYLAQHTHFTGAVSRRRTTPRGVQNTYAGFHGTTGVFDGFSIIPASGTITGTIQVWGRKDS